MLDLMQFFLFEKYPIRRKLGIFSLSLVFAIGIFFPAVEASQTYSESVVNVSTFTATFTFGLAGPFDERVFFPDEIAFNASGTPASFPAPGVYSTPFAPWEVTYGTAPWSFVRSAVIPSFVSTQLRQVVYSEQAAHATGTFHFSWIAPLVATAGELRVNAYAYSADLLVSPMAGFPKTVAVGISDEAHAQVVTRNRVMFFWVAEGVMAFRSLVGNSLDPVTTSMSAETYYAGGIGGAFVNVDAGDFVVVTYKTSDTSFNVVTFPETNYSAAVRQGHSPSLQILGRCVSVFQNPRSRKIYFLYVGTGNLARIIPATFDGTTWTFDTEIPIAGSYGFIDGNDGAGFPNFESVGVVGDLAWKLKEHSIRGTATQLSFTFPDQTDVPTICYARESQIDRALMILRDDFATNRFSLYSRSLVYPKKAVFDRATKVLHIEGPPLLNTPVNIKVIFPEMATATCQVQAANTAGGTTGMEGATGVIAGAGTKFTLTFDKAMMASFSSWVGAGNKIQLIDSTTSTAVPTAYVSAGASSVVFQNSAALAFDRAYWVSVASDVLDSLGTQLWAGATFTVTTQSPNSVVLASEVVGLAAFSNAGYTTAVANGSEINATSTLYLRLQAVDPAYNTIDFSTASYYLNGTSIGTLSMSQAVASSVYLFTVPAATETRLPWPGTHTYVLRYQSVAPAASISFRVSFPWLVSHSPTDGAADIAINTPIVITLSEPIGASSVTTQTVRLSRSGIAASYSVSVAGSQVIIDPDDTTEGFLRSQTLYDVAIGTGVTDLVGNPFVSTTATYTFQFTTQNTVTPPTTILSLSLFKDIGLLSPYQALEEVGGSQTVYIKVTATDLATLTRDVTTATLNLPWSGDTAITLNEIASNSGGIFTGSINLGSFPIFSIPPPPLPPATVTSTLLTWTSESATPKTATLSITFPWWVPGSTKVQTLSGTANASAATSVRIDTPITVAFEPPIASASVTAANLAFTKAGVPVPATYQVRDDGRIATITPSALLTPSTVYKVEGPYVTGGLRSLAGNPLHEPFAFTFTTQAATTDPVSIDTVSLFTTSSYTLPDLAEGSDYLGTATLYVEMTGVDGSPTTIDTTLASYSNGLTVTLTETAANSGKFRGPLSYANWPNNTALAVESVKTPGKRRTLQITYPVATPLIPASGAIDVSIGTIVRVQASEDLLTTSITATSVRLLLGGADVAGTRSYDPVGRTITFTPSTGLGFSQTYTVIASGLRDLVGNPQEGVLISEFTTQANAPTPPVTINQINMFADAGFTVPVASGATVLPGTTLYVQILATDLAAATVDTTRFVLSSPSGASVTTTLTETNVNTGDFRGSVLIFNEENRVLQVFSETNPAVRKDVILPAKPMYSLIDPASGAIDLPLNRKFVIQTSKPYAPGTVTPATVRLIDSTGVLAPTITLVNAQEFQVQALLATFSEVILRLENGILDTDGLAFPFLRASFTTLLPQLTTCTVYSNNGYSTVLVDGAKVLPGATVYVQAQGNDPRPGEVDSINVLVSDGLATTTQTLSEDLAGRFRGPVTIPATPNTLITITPQLNPTLRRQLVTPPNFVVASVSPASGAIEVPADAWPTWTFATPIDPLLNLNGRFTVTQLPATAVTGTIAISGERKTVTFQPDAHFELLTDYELTVAADVRDEDGRTLGQAFITRFVSQSPPAPPFTVLHLKHYTDASFNTESSFVVPEGSLFLEVRAVDTSSATVDTTRVRVDSSDGSLVSVELTLIETGYNTGLYRCVHPVALTPGTTVQVVSQADGDFVLTLQVRTRATLSSVTPASGTVGLSLDASIALTFSRTMSAVSLLSGIEVVGSGGLPIGVTGVMQPDQQTWLLKPTVQWATGTLHTVTLKNLIRDTDGVALATTVFQFTTRGIGPALFDLVTGLPPRDQELVSVWNEAVPGPLRMIATTTSLFDLGLETRSVRFAWSGGSAMATVTELATAPGRFQGSFDPGLARGTAATATLEFAQQPQRGFVIAALPELVARTPAGASATISDLETVTASFTRMMSPDAASEALRMLVGGAPVPTRLLSGSSPAKILQWGPFSRWPSGMSGTAQFNGLVDVLGQPVVVPGFDFVVSGTAGLNVFLDDQFRQPLVGSIFSQNRLYLELIGPLSTGDPSNPIQIHAVTGRQATVTLRLAMLDTASGSRRFRGMLEINTPARSLPTLSVPMVPGERLTLSSPSLPNVSRVLYFRAAGDAPPTVITGAVLYSEKHYAQRVDTTFQTPTLFIEVAAEDRNWLFSDTTRVKVTSDSDLAGIELVLTESDIHSGLFRGFVTLDAKSSFGAANRLIAKPGDRVTVISSTDPRVTVSARWMPENSLSNVLPWPNPARGDRIHFQYRLAMPGKVDLTIYDTSGEEIYLATMNGQEGENRFTWVFPRRLANGVYLFNLEMDPTLEFPTRKRRVRGKFAVLR